LAHWHWFWGISLNRNSNAANLWDGKTQSGEIGDPVTMRDRRDFMVENLLLRHQLHVVLRSHPRPDLKTRDRFFWLLVRRGRTPTPSGG